VLFEMRLRLRRVHRVVQATPGVFELTHPPGDFFGVVRSGIVRILSRSFRTTDVPRSRICLGGSNAIATFTGQGAKVDLKFKPNPRFGETQLTDPQDGLASPSGVSWRHAW
jgi:hypothetical protein